ncbi:hypothetical protein RvY_15358 [Ramazzottius varieornatus]|uniref:Uncharacterized protein n=1 Tax=Ramazzottius varieornatus TaxID=947166 RepID=A0A1D1VUM7_RAMVA|nr:hypothetical protein RvY_15358 [Ramazzottius varieornatus]
MRASVHNVIIASWSSVRIPEAFGAMSLNTTSTGLPSSMSSIFFCTLGLVKSESFRKIAPGYGVMSRRSTPMTIPQEAFFVFPSGTSSSTYSNIPLSVLSTLTISASLVSLVMSGGM